MLASVSAFGDMPLVLSVLFRVREGWWEPREKSPRLPGGERPLDWKSTPIRAGAAVWLQTDETQDADCRLHHELTAHLAGPGNRA